MRQTHSPTDASTAPTIPMEDCSPDSEIMTAVIPKAESSRSVSPATVLSTRRQPEPSPVISDSCWYRNMLQDANSQSLLDQVKAEVTWTHLRQSSKPLPYVVALQGDFDEANCHPIFRQPLDEQPVSSQWTPTVRILRDLVSPLVDHPLNHAQIVMYRDGEDYSSEHSDVSLDIKKGSSMVEVSLGAPRTVLLRPKRMCDGKRRPSPRTTTKVHLLHGSVLVLGWKTNREMTREIKRCSRYKPDITLSDESTLTPQLTHDGESVMTLTPVISPILSSIDETTRTSEFGDVHIAVRFRQIATFQTPAMRLFGQGATSRTFEELNTCSYRSMQSEVLLTKKLALAFKKENRHADTDWDELYEHGFDILPSKLIPRNKDRCLRVPNNDDPTDLLALPDLEHVESPPLDNEDEDEDDDTPATIMETSISHSMSMSELPGNGIAMLAIDLQNDFLGEDPSFFFGRMGSPIAPRRAALLKRIDQLADEVRKMGGVVYFVKSRYGAWSSPQHHHIRSLPNQQDLLPGAHMDKVECCGAGSSGAEFHPEAEDLIHEYDLVFVKEWYSAFMETTLHAQLGRLGVRHLVVCGVTTNHSVAATVRSASHLGYNVILSSDATAQVDPRLQKQSEQRLRKYYGTLLGKNESLDSHVNPDPCVPPPSQDDFFSPLTFDGYAHVSGLGAGDSLLIPNFLPEDESENILKRLIPKAGKKTVVDWRIRKQRNGGNSIVAYHVEENENGHVPVYRTRAPQPWDRSYHSAPFSGILGKLKTLVQEQAGHSFNWGRMLLFRDGYDSFGWHSDKCVDLEDNSFLATVALGGERVIELQAKSGDTTYLAPQRISLPHNSLLLLGPETNRLFVKSVQVDKECTEPHVQICLRDVATFFAGKDENKLPKLYGKGSCHKSNEDLQAASERHRILVKAGVTMAGLYTFALFRKGCQSLSGSLFMSAVATAAASLWFSYERKKAYEDESSRLEKINRQCNDEPISASEARNRLL